MELFLVRRQRQSSNQISRKIFRDRENPFDCEDLVFFRRYRFTKETAKFLIDELYDSLKRPTNRSKAFPPHIIVLTSLSLLGSSNFQFINGQLSFHNVSQSAVSKMLAEFLEALIKLTKKFIKFPKTEVEISEKKQGFYRKYGFPNVIGAVDGSHIAIQKPSVWDAYSFFNRKSFYSINVQAVCDANACFTDVVIRWPGSTHDSHIYKCSSLYQFLHSDEFPENTWLLGDSGYPLQHCMLTPVIAPSTLGEKSYNKFHTSTRKIIEQAFGILKSRFRKLSKSGGNLCYGIEKSVKIILCCVILHNIAKKRNEPDFEIEYEEDDFEVAQNPDESHHENREEPDITTSSGRRGRINRDLLIASFENQ